MNTTTISIQMEWQRCEYIFPDNFSKMFALFARVRLQATEQVSGLRPEEEERNRENVDFGIPQKIGEKKPKN